MKKVTKTDLNQGGVYAITNTITGVSYIGDSSNLGSRLIQHIYALRKKQHPNYHLEVDVRKHGIHNFEFKILHIENDKDARKEFEVFYIVQSNTHNINCRDQRTIKCCHGELMEKVLSRVEYEPINLGRKKYTKY